jgi:hypothetical protein
MIETGDLYYRRIMKEKGRQEQEKKRMITGIFFVDFRPRG